MIVADTHPSIEDLEGLALGTLEDAALTAVEMHVDGCPTCQERVANSSGDNFVTVLRRVHAQTTRQADTVSQNQTPRPLGADDTDATEIYDRVPPELAEHERYRIVRLLGAGGMGSVYEAEHRVMQRTVAVKVINSALTSRPAAVERFRREVRAAARMAHPNIVTTYDAEDASGALFLVMEYVEGVSLGRLVKEQGPLPVAEACDCVRQAALGLCHAHEQGLVHRDVKPDNLIRTASGQVKVLDFGLAALIAERDGDLTDANIVMGTPDYMAPEQAEAPHSVDIRADVYSLGCTLYFLLTGKVPFPASTSLLKILAHREQPLPAFAKTCPAMTPELSRIMARMLAKKPEDRYQTPTEVATALEPFAKPGLISLPPRRLPQLVGVVLAALLAGIVLAGSVVYRIQTDKGALIITTLTDDVEVIIKQGGKQINVIDTKTKKSLRLWSGTYDLELKGAPAGLKLDIDKVTLMRDKTVLARIERVPKGVDVAVKLDAEKKVGEVFRKRWDNHLVTSGVDLSPDGRLLISMHWGGARLWDVASGQVVQDWPGWLGQFTLDGKQIVTSVPKGEPGGELRLSETVGGKLIRKFGQHPNGIWALRMCPDGRNMLTGGPGGVQRKWNLATGDLVKKTGEPTAELWGGREAPDFQKRTGIAPDYLLPGGREVLGSDLVDGRSVAIYEIASGRLVRKIPLAGTGRIDIVGSAACYGRRYGNRMALAGADGAVYVVDLVAGKEIARFSAGNFLPKCLAISADDRFVAACASNEQSDVVVWRLPEPPPAAEPKP